MKFFRLMFQLFLILAFLAGIYVIFLVDKKEKFERMTNEKNESTEEEEEPEVYAINPVEIPEKNDLPKCPDLLLHKDGKYTLYDTTSPNEEPIVFSKLSEYTDYLDAQKENGSQCPVLFVQEEIDAQGKNVLRRRPSPYDMQGGLQVDLSPPPLASSMVGELEMYPGIDKYGFDSGTRTLSDEIHDSTKNTEISDNPMDPNWGGVLYTQKMVDSGKYDENIITKPLLFQPKGLFNVEVPSGFAQPKDIY